MKGGGVMSKSIMQDERLDRPTGQYTAYRRKKEHIDREAWEKPCSVCGGKTTLYQQTEEAQAELEKRLRG
nr:MAG TPA: restriction alleviation protein [Caudoviricetes sp.]